MSTPLNLSGDFRAVGSQRFSVLEFRSAGLATVYDSKLGDVLTGARDGLPLTWHGRRAAERFAAVLNRSSRAQATP